jgi:hypothetical protein
MANEARDRDSGEGPSEPSGFVSDPKDLVRLWRISLATPVIYMLISIVVKRVAFADSETDGFFRLSREAYEAALASVTALAVASTVAVLWLRRSRRRSWAPGDAAQARPAEHAEAFRRYRFQTIVMLILCDGVAFLGLALYLLQGDVTAQGVMALWAWGAYAVSRPGESRQGL